MTKAIHLMDELRKIDLNLLLALHALLSERHVTRAALRCTAANRRSATPWRSCANTSTTLCWYAKVAAWPLPPAPNPWHNRYRMH